MAHTKLLGDVGSSPDSHTGDDTDHVEDDEVVLNVGGNALEYSPNNNAWLQKRSGAELISEAASPHPEGILTQTFRTTTSGRSGLGGDKNSTVCLSVFAENLLLCLESALCLTFSFVLWIWDFCPE